MEQKELEKDSKKWEKWKEKKNSEEGEKKKKKRWEPYLPYFELDFLAVWSPITCIQLCHLNILWYWTGTQIQIRKSTVTLRGNCGYAYNFEGITAC